MKPHRVETWWTTATWTSMCMDCPWETEGSHEEVTEAAAVHTRPQPMRKAVGRV